VKHRSEDLEAEFKYQRCRVLNLGDQLEQEASRLAEGKTRCSRADSRGCERSSTKRNVGNAKHEGSSTFKVWKFKLRRRQTTILKLKRERCYSRQLDGECRKVANIFYKVINEKNVFENQLNQLQKELNSEKQRAERL
jgi:hypothetical protein